MFFYKTVTLINPLITLPCMKKWHPKTKEEEESEISAGKKDDDVYGAQGREDLEESDEITPEEGGFMEGYEEEDPADCATCGKVLSDAVVEKEVDNEVVRFCSDRCAARYKKRA